jgi:DNA-binding MarR family transcriptional regulator
MEWRPDPDRHLSLLFDVFALGLRTRTLVALAMSGCELRPDEYAAYSVVFESPRITMTGLARELGAPVTTAADYVRAMQRRGHVRREGHPTDNRSSVITLTAAGLRAHRAASAAFQRAHRALLTALAPTAEADVRAGLGALIEATDRAVTALTPAPGRRAPARA